MIRCILGFVLLLFVDSINRLLRVSEAVEAARQNPLSVAGAVSSTTDNSEIQARKFYAQRNMYLCGFALFLHLILTQTYKLMGDLLEAKEALEESSHEQPSKEIADLKEKLAEKEENIEILKSQSESLSKEYNSIEDSKKK